MVKKIIVGNNPNEMFINPQSRELYVVNRQSDTLSIISTDGLYVKRTILLAKQPYAVTYDSNRGLIYVSIQNPDKYGVSVINPYNKQTCEMSMTHLETKPSYIMFNPRSNLTYVSNPDTNTISTIGIKALEEQNSCNINPMRSVQVGINPINVKVDSIHGRAYVLNRISNNISIINTTSKDPSVNYTEIPSYGARISAIGVDDNKNRLFIANGKNDTISVIDGNTLKPIGNSTQVGSSPVALAVDNNSHRLYVVNNGDDTVSVINGPSLLPIGDRIPVGSSPVALAVDNNSHRLYVVNNGDDTVSVINSTSLQPIGNTIQVAESPTAIAIDPTTRTVFVANSGDNSVSIIDGAALKTSRPIPVGSSPTSMTLIPRTINYML